MYISGDGNFGRNEARAILTKELGIINPSERFLKYYFCTDGEMYVSNVNFKTLKRAFDQHKIIQLLAIVHDMPEGDEVKEAVYNKAVRLIKEHQIVKNEGV